eukprot:1182228-Prorocentrum_minimum.AAC.4
MSRVCYYDAPDEVVAALLHATGPPDWFGNHNDQEGMPSPMEFCVNQGNWRPLQLILELVKKKSVLSSEFLADLTSGAFNTSVYYCVKVRKRKTT